jgi:serine/threonine protein kinase/uncharacterized membrane protein
MRIAINIDKHRFTRDEEKSRYSMIQYSFDALTGITLGSYRLERLIGYSQKGPVFLARPGPGPTTYLVRFLTEPTDQRIRRSNDYLERFHYLASQIAALQHPALLPLLDYGIYQGIPYLVSPNLALRSLRRRLANNVLINTFTIGRYLDQIAAALDYAHEHGVFHGNLTLDSLFVRLNGQLIVADMGMRGLLELIAPGNSLAQSSKESAPEQFLGRPAGPYTDVYALGAILYQLLTGSPVFVGTTADEIADQHLFAAVPPLSQRRTDLPAGLDSILARALAKDPKQRYQQAGALATAYHRVMDPNDRNSVPFGIISSPTVQAQQPFAPVSIQVEGLLTEHEWSTNVLAVVARNAELQQQAPQTSIPPPLEDETGSPTLKRVPALLKQTPVQSSPEEVSDADSLDLPGNRQDASQHRVQRQKTRRTSLITLLLFLLASSTVGIVLISRQNATWTGLTGQGTFFESSKILLALCIVLAIAFTVAFNIISRISLSTTRHESAYTILWQLFCALLAPLFLPFDHFFINLNPHMLLLLVISVALWALVDAFLFSAFKHEEASVLAAIFPLNFVFTFVVSVVFFHSVIKPAIVVGFLIIMAASLLIGLYHTHFRPSKGMLFALLYSFFLGVALGFNSEVVKSFSIPPYMVAAFLFPAAANLFIFLRPKGSELRYELQVQWKKILLNAAIMDISFFFLLKAFQLGNVPQVVALSASSTLLTALAGIVILKEDRHIALKIIAAGLAMLGVVLITLGANL